MVSSSCRGVEVPKSSSLSKLDGNTSEKVKFIPLTDFGEISGLPIAALFVCLSKA